MRSEERRLALARERGREAVTSLAREACLTTMPLICRPPPPVEPFAYGNLVPLGFLLRAVNVDAYGTSAVPTAGAGTFLSSARKNLNAIE